MGTLIYAIGIGIVLGIFEYIWRIRMIDTLGHWNGAYGM